MAELIDFINHDLGRAHHLFNRRATTGLYLLLRQHEITNREIIIPVNVCYSLVNAIIMTENRPVFVDVEARDGNTRLRYVEERLTSNTFAVVLPHSLGNPCSDTKAIAERCRDRGVLLIEDCAVAIGCTIDLLRDKNRRCLSLVKQ